MGVLHAKRALTAGGWVSDVRIAIEAGRLARIEGPYGRFDFEDGKRRQIWVGAGIGIAPFVAKMRERATLRSGTVVDLFHPTSEASDAALAKMRAAAAAAGVNLHIFVSSRGEKLDASKI